MANLTKRAANVLDNNTKYNTIRKIMCEVIM